MWSDHRIALETHTWVRFFHKAVLRVEVMGATQVSQIMVDHRDVTKLTIPTDVLALEFFDISSGSVNICGQNVILTNTGHTPSPIHYITNDASIIEALGRRIKPWARRATC